MVHRICLLTFVLILTFGLTSNRLYAQNTDSQSVAEANKTQVAQLVKKLGDTDFTVREDAQKRLLAMGGTIKSELEAELKTVQDPEVYERVQYILMSIPVVWDMPGDEPEVTEFLRRYRQADAFYRLVVMELLRRMPLPLQIKTLDRIIQKEPNDGNALFAAMAFWYWRPEQSSTEFTQTIKPVLDSWKDSQKPAAKSLYYLANYKQTRTEATVWFNMQFNKQNPPNSSNLTSRTATDYVPSFIATLLTEYARREAESQLSDADIPDGKRIQFGELLYKESSSQVIIVSGNVVRKSIKVQSIITSAIASTGNRDENSATVLAVVPVIGQIYMLHRGMNKEAKRWLDGEIAQKTPIDVSFYMTMWAETFWEYGYSEMAVHVSDSIPNEEVAKRVTARKEYYRACWAKENGKFEEQWTFIQNALKIDPMDIDCLIMQWEMCNVPAEQNKVSAITDEVRKVKEEELEKTLSKIETEIENGGIDMVSQLNGYAWLAVNTNRHLDKALNYAQEMATSGFDSSAYADTLAHVYAAMGNIDKAIEVQTQALKMDPTSNALYENLQKFIKMK